MAEETTQGTADEGAEADAGRFGRAREYVNDRYTKASGAVRDGYNTVREKVEDVDFAEMMDQVRGYVRSHPGKAMLIAVGVGFVVGLLLRREDEE